MDLSPDLSRVAVFGTTDIQREEPVCAGQRPAYRELDGRVVHRTYTTGKLEQAHRQDLEIYVCSIRPMFGPHDRWWRLLVPPSRVFHATGLLGDIRAGELGGALLDPWRRLYAALGVPWPDGVTDDRVARELLIAAHGVIDGASFTGLAA